jgi:hypothetical protein
MESVNMKFTELVEKKLGGMLLRLPLTSHHAGHNKVQSIVKDYIEPGDSLEGQFIVDLFKSTTPEIIEKWFGGDENATDLIMKIK